jgi:hypothetical protein
MWQTKITAKSTILIKENRVRINPVKLKRQNKSRRKVEIRDNAQKAGNKSNYSQQVGKETLYTRSLCYDCEHRWRRP